MQTFDRRRLLLRAAALALLPAGVGAMPSSAFCRNAFRRTPPRRLTPSDHTFVLQSLLGRCDFTSLVTRHYQPDNRFKSGFDVMRDVLSHSGVCPCGGCLIPALLPRLQLMLAANERLDLESAPHDPKIARIVEPMTKLLPGRPIGGTTNAFLRSLKVIDATFGAREPSVRIAIPLIQDYLIDGSSGVYALRPSAYFSPILLGAQKKGLELKPGPEIPPGGEKQSPGAPTSALAELVKWLFKWSDAAGGLLGAAQSAKASSYCGKKGTSASACALDIITGTIVTGTTSSLSLGMSAVADVVKKR